MIKSFRNFRFDKLSPLIRKTFGEQFVGVENSGVDALFPPSGVGRPRKRRRSEDGADPFKKEPSRPTSEHKGAKIAEFYLVARDSVDNELYVFVEWEGTADPPGSWIPWVSLAQESKDWVEWHMEKQFPCFNLFRSPPILRCLDSVVTLVDDSDSGAL